MRKSATYTGSSLAGYERPVGSQHSELLRRLNAVTGNQLPMESGGQKLKKQLLNVMIQRSLGPVHVVMSLESTVADLTRAVVDIYVRESRRPSLAVTDPNKFELHYSSFSLESLDPNEKLMELGSRNFFMCPKAETVTTNMSSCSNEAKRDKNSVPALSRFMEFLL